MKTKTIVYTALLGAFTFIASYIQIPFGGSINFTLQTVVVILSGLLLAPLYAMASQVITLLLLVLLRDGFGIVQKPSFGFIIGFILLAGFIAYAKPKLHLWLTLFIGECLLYSVGISYMAYILNGQMGKNLALSAILGLGLFPFIIPDILKAIVSVLIYKRLKKIN